MTIKGCPFCGENPTVKAYAVKYGTRSASAHAFCRCAKCKFDLVQKASQRQIEDFVRKETGKSCWTESYYEPLTKSATRCICKKLRELVIARWNTREATQ